MQINQNLSPFEAQVLQLLTELKFKVDDLAGSEKTPGRIPLLETKVFRLTLAVVALGLISGAAVYPHALTIFTWLIR